MPLWERLLDAVGLLVVLVLLFGAALVVRRRLLSRHGGTFEMSCRIRPTRAGRGWLLGLGRYSGETLEWFRVFSIWPWPKCSWQRSTMTYESRRDAEGVELMSLYPDHVVVACLTPDGDVELALSQASLTGLQAWLESRPPGVDWSR